MLSLGNAPSLLIDAGPVISSNWAVGVVAETDAGGQIRASISQPVHIEQALMTYRLPIARSLDGDVRYATRVVDFGKISREVDFGLSYRQGAASSPLEFVSFAELRSNVAAITTGSEYRLGLRMKLGL